MRLLKNTILCSIVLVVLAGINYRLTEANPSTFLYLAIAPIVSGLFVFPALGFGLLAALAIAPAIDTPVSSALAWSQAAVAAVLFVARALVPPVPSGSLREGFFAKYGRMYRAILLLCSGIPILVIALFDMGRYGQALPWCIVVLLHAIAMPVPAAQKTGSKVTALGNAILISVSLVFSAAFVEVGARVFLQPEPTFPRLNSYSKDYLFLPTANARGKHHISISPDAWIEIAIHNSSLGIRDREYGPKDPDNEFRIVLLGDSFTMGHAVEMEETISRLLEAKLRDRSSRLAKKITVINAGIGGGGPWQYLGMWRERAKSLEPDLVILQLFPGNDIENSLEEAGKCQRAYDVRLQQGLQTALRQDEWPFRVELWFLRGSRVYRAFKRVTGNRQWFATLISRCRLTPEYHVPPLPENEDRPFFLEYNLAEWYPELDEGLQRLKEYTRTLKEECNAAGPEIIAYCIPDLNEVGDDTWNDWMNKLKGKAAYERKKGLAKVEEVLDELEIEHFSVFDELRAHPPVDSIFYPRDGHMNGIGNGIVAQKIYDVLRNDYFPRHPELGLLPDPAAPVANFR